MMTFNKQRLFSKSADEGETVLKISKKMMTSFMNDAQQEMSYIKISVPLLHFWTYKESKMVS